MQYPSIGRLVHYYLSLEAAEQLGTPEPLRTEPYASVVTRVHDGNTVDLDVHLKPTDRPGSQLRVSRAPFSGTPVSGCWRWAPHVAASEGAAPSPERAPECVAMIWTESEAL